MKIAWELCGNYMEIVWKFHMNRMAIACHGNVLNATHVDKLCVLAVSSETNNLEAISQILFAITWESCENCKRIAWISTGNQLLR